LLYNLPGGRFALPPRLDPATGEPLRRKGGPAQRYWIGGQGVETSPEGEELSRYGVNAPVYRAGSEYAGVRQTGEQARALQRASGSEINRETRAVLASPEYRAATTDEERADLLRAGLSRARAAADIAVGSGAAREPKAQATAEWQAVPKYRGMDGTPDEIRRLNARISRAKAALAAAERKGGDAKGDWIDAHPEEYDLTRYRERPAKDLERDKDEIAERYPGVEFGG
jgi:hypothetical protein